MPASPQPRRTIAAVVTALFLAGGAAILVSGASVAYLGPLIVGAIALATTLLILLD